MTALASVNQGSSPESLESRVFIGGQIGRHRTPKGLTLATQSPALQPSSHPEVKLIQLDQGPKRTKTGVHLKSHC